MSNFLTEPCRRGLTSNEKENEIRAIYYCHWENMKKQMKLTIETIDGWRFQNIQAINGYADEQVQILRDDYDHQRLVFDRMREEHLATASVYRSSKQPDLFHELRDACQLLKFQVAQLEYVRNETQRPKVIVVEEQTRRKKQENINTHTPKFQEHEECWKAKDTTEIKQNGNEKAGVFSKTTSSVSNETQ
jgi:hypothetical protein